MIVESHTFPALTEMSAAPGPFGRVCCFPGIYFDTGIFFLRRR